MYVLERVFADGETGEIIGPFASAEDTERYAAARYPRLECLPSWRPDAAGCLVVVQLTRPRWR